MKRIRIFITALGTLTYLGVGNAQNDSQLSKVYKGETVEILAPGLISTKFGEYSPTYDSMRDELYFMRRTPAEFDYTIYKTKLSAKGWSTPIVVSFSGKFRDAGPFLAPDGNTIFFDSRRPSPNVAANSINIWYSNRRDDGWSKPKILLAPSINSEDEPYAGQNEYGPAVDEEGILYFYSFRRPFRGGAHYISTPPKYQDVNINSKLPDPSAQTFVSYLYISPNGKLALLEGRAPGRNDTDIFCSCKLEDGNWSEPFTIPEINTTANEGGPSLTTDAKFLLFTSNRNSQNNLVSNANLYIAKVNGLLDDCREKIKE